jgi:hypothetical protein
MASRHFNWNRPLNPGFKPVAGFFTVRDLLVCDEMPKPRSNRLAPIPTMNVRGR